MLLMGSKRRAAASSALFVVLVLIAASTVTPTTGRSQNDCMSYNSSSTAGNLWDASIADPSYFGCADDGFLVAVEASYITSINSLSWTCSGGDVVGSFSSGSFVEGSISFTVGITEVQTRVTEGARGFLSDMFFGGYDVDSSWASLFFALKGPVGSNDVGNVLLPDTSGSYCGDGTFATGVTVWSSDGFVYGIVLECAYLTATCAPPDYPANLLEDESGSGIEPTTTVAATDIPSSSGDTAPSISTPSASVSTSFSADAPTSSGGVVPDTDTPSPSVSTSSNAGAPSSSGGAGPAIDTPSPSVSISSGTDAPNSSANTVPATHQPSASGSTAATTDTPGLLATIAPATASPTSPSSPGGSMATTDPPSSSRGTVPATDPPSSFGDTNSATDTPSPSANSASTSGTSTSSVSTAVIASVAAVVGVLLAICIGVSWCLYRRGARRARHPLKPWDTFGTPVLSAGRGSGGSRTPEGGAAAHASEAGSSSSRRPPPAYAESPI